MNPNPNAGDDAFASNPVVPEGQKKPKLTLEFDPSAIVNIEYLEDEGDLESPEFMLALLNQY